MPKFVRTPGPLLEPIKCYIVREKASGGLLTKAPHCYKLYLEDGDVFLLAARRRERTKCPSYVVSLDQNELSRSGTGYCGKIKVWSACGRHLSWRAHAMFVRCVIF